MHRYTPNIQQGKMWGLFMAIRRKTREKGFVQQLAMKIGDFVAQINQYCLHIRPIFGTRYGLFGHRACRRTHYIETTASLAGNQHNGQQQYLHSENAHRHFPLRFDPIIP